MIVFSTGLAHVIQLASEVTYISDYVSVIYLAIMADGYVFLI